MKRLFIIPLVSALLIACGPDAQAPSASATSALAASDSSAETKTAEPADARTQTAETAPREAPQLKPAFEGQTRAPLPESSENWTVETVATGLEHPWALDFLPDGSMLVTERPGRLRHVSADGTLSDPIDGLPEVDARNQGGLLDVAAAPDFESSRLIFFSFAEPHDDGTNNTALARARLSDNHRALEDVETIFSQQPAVNSQGHFGSRIVFENDNTLWLGMGDRQRDAIRQNAQDPSNHIGTVVRLHFDGSVPADNPFVDDNDKQPEIFSWGHRNIQGAVKDPQTGHLWTVEHGPRGGDELNLTEAGKNYGWPTISYGIEYQGGEVYDGLTRAEGMEQPVYFWDPVIAPSGMDIYRGDAFPEWQGDFFVGGLRSQRVSRLVMDDDRVVAEEWLPMDQRIRDVKTGPDGFIYLVTDESNGKILRIVPESGD
ncbi:MAG TPA: PQQ-dependent sugar dehydrogenase [Wenzhouxiangella sp.]|nr:PQQ-dependent sugar dehydrogenase [Wenzhouxiangella sp.]